MSNPIKKAAAVKSDDVVNAVYASIRYDGIKCIEESAADGFFSDSDEIFLTGSISNLEGYNRSYTSMVHTDVDTGEYHSAGSNAYMINRHPMDEKTTLAVVLDLWEEDNEELALSGEYTDLFLKGLEKSFKEHTKKDGLLPKNVASAFASLASAYARINNGFKNDHIGSHQFLILVDKANKEIIIGNNTYPLTTNTEFSFEFTAQKQGGSHRAYFYLELEVWVDDKKQMIIDRARNLPEDQFKIVFGPLANIDREALFETINNIWKDEHIAKLEQAMNEKRELKWID